MTPAPELAGTPTGWHLTGTVLAAYADGAVSDATAWSAEEHLMACSRCRSSLATVDTAPVDTAADPTAADTDAVTERPIPRSRPDLVAVRARLLAELPAQAAVRPGTATRRLRVLLGNAPGPFRAWTGAVAFVLGCAALLDVAGVPLAPVGVGVGDGVGPTAGWVQLLAPLLPILGVACAYGAADPAQELLAATPSGGLRLLLHRCTAVLGVSIPPAVAVGLATGGVDGLAWLLPAFALTVLTLALGSVIRLDAAAAVSAGIWVVVIGGPALHGTVPRAVTAQAAPAWGVALLLAAAVLLARADQLHRPGGSRPDGR